MTSALAGALFVACGLGASAYALMAIVRADRAKKWPVVDGEVADTRVFDVDDTQFEQVSYRYAVGGQPYRNDRVRFGALLAPPSTLRNARTANDSAGNAALARRYPRGSRVVVRYNPRQPADSTLYAEVAGEVWIYLLLGAVFVWMGARALT